MSTAILHGRIDPQTAMLLRVRALEAIIFGNETYDALLPGLSLGDGETQDGKKADGAAALAEGKSAGEEKSTKEVKDGDSKESDTTTAQAQTVSLAVRAQRIQEKLLEGVKQDETVSAFLANYNRDAAYLSPSFLFSGFVPSSGDESAASQDASTKKDAKTEKLSAQDASLISTESQLSLLSEMLPVWRSLAAQLEECSVLEKRNVLSIFDGAPSPAVKRDAEESSELAPAKAGAEALPLLSKKLQEFKQGPHAERVKEFESLERRVGDFLITYTDYVDSMSQLFVQWDEALLDMEKQVTKLERAKLLQQKAEAV